MLILDENQGKGSYSLCLDLEYISLSVSEVNNEMVNKKKTLHNLCKRKHLIVHLYRVHPVCLHPQLSYTDGTYCIHPQLEFTDGAYHNIITYDMHLREYIKSKGTSPPPRFSHGCHRVRFVRCMSSWRFYCQNGTILTVVIC